MLPNEIEKKVSFSSLINKRKLYLLLTSESFNYHDKIMHTHIKA